MNFREQKEFKVFRELLHSVPGLEARLMDSSEEEITVEAIPIYVEELLLLLTCYVEGTS